MGRWASRAAIVLALVSGLVQAGEPVVEWERWIGSTPPWVWMHPGNGNFGSRSAVADAAGNLFVSGKDSSTGRGVVARLDASSGAVRWEDRAAPSSAEVIAMGPDGNPVVAGRAPNSIAVVKYAGTDGKILWRRDIPPATAAASWLAVRAVAVDATGSVLIHAHQDTPSTQGFLFRLGSDGTPAWQREGLRAFALAGDGDVFLVDKTLPGEAPGWALVRVKGSDGSIAWRRHQAEEARFPIVLAVAPDGDVVASGILRPVDTGIGTGIAETTTIRTLRASGADGTVRWRWTRDWLPSDENVNAYFVGTSTDHALAIDRQGAVFVTGQQGRDLFVRRHAPDTGAVQWEARRPSGPGVGSVGMAIAIDAAGHAVVTGVTGWWYSMSVPYGDVFSASYEGASGRLRWSATYDGAGGSFDSGWDAVPAGDAVYVVASTREGSAGSGIRAWKYGPGVLPSPNHQGLWWASPAGSESGWGLGIAHQGDTLFATWFTYDDGGQPLWLVAPAMTRTAGGQFAGKVYRTRGPDYGSAVFDGAAMRVEELGNATLSFAADGKGRFEYILYLSPSVANSKPITRQAIASPAPACVAGDPAAGSTNFTDLWWAAPAGSESGWGLYVAHQGDVLFAVWFTYSGGTGTWFVAPELRRGEDGRWAGALLRTTGPSFRAAPWNPAQVTTAPVGTATLEFADGLSGRFTWRVGEASQSKAIVRQSFALPGTDCR